jgi:competence protein ComEC
VSRWTELHIFRGFPRDIAGVILGMTIGRVELMSREIQESFRTSGISHILVVSGSNITFLIVLLSGILKYLPLRRRYRISAIMVFVLLYSTLVGWDVPVVRSTIMGLIAFFAIEYRSRVSSLAILFLIGDLLLIYSPLSLLYDPAFGLSFAATMSIILYYAPLLARFRSYHIPSAISSILAITVAASLGTLPVTIYHF